MRGYETPDREACRDLWVELTEWHRRIYDSPGIGGNDPGRQFDEHLGRVGAEHIWVAEVDGAVVALAGLIPGDNEAEMEPLVVSEAYRGEGIGRLLAEYVIAAARRDGVRQLKVRPVARNREAVRAFHALGFNVIGHVDLFMDLGPPDQQSWQAGERIAKRDFRI